MKNYISAWQDYETVFNGDKVTMKLLPFKRSEFLQALPILDRFYATGKEIGAAAEGDVNLKRVMFIDTFIGDMSTLLFGHVVDIDGFLIDDEKPTLERLIELPFAGHLLQDIIFKLVNISTVQKEEEKN